ncbi:hypothetical protein [Patulibacter sp.]|uniref:hypothetical protein n=1 Tax=Patulibacter sp. TaxID=1912859 RepID=UPI002723B6B5|nr:hypothetical protein [Patulibacter sp.]MDO9410123.1 hypothetical protein [Patulibacter sp.]
MSFFDDDDFDEPTHVADAPRRDGGRPGGLAGFVRNAAGGRGGGGGGGRRTAPGGIDPQTARTRQLVALGVIVLVLILLVFAVNSCVKSGRTSALKDYSRDVTSVLQESSSEVAEPMFAALSSGEDATTIQSALNRLRGVAEEQAETAKSFSEPGDDNGKAAQRDLELAMNLRAEAIRVIAEQVPAAKADEGTADAAVRQIAGQLSAFLASDVVILQRTKPLIDQALADKDVSGADVSAPRTVTDVTVLDPVTVQGALGGGGSSSGSSGSSSGPVRDRSSETPTDPNVTHGTNLAGVSFGSTALTAGTPADVTGRAISVQVQNSGQADETNLEVGATFTPSGGRAASTKKALASIAQGATSTVELELPSGVRSGQSGELVITVGGVPGEENLDNNEATYTVTIGG